MHLREPRLVPPRRASIAPKPGCPSAAEITPAEPDPGHAGEGSAMPDTTPSWGIEPVPERLRVLGAPRPFLLWTNLGISLLVLVAASYLGLPLKQALLATLVGGLIGNAMLGVAALIGADAACRRWCSSARRSGSAARTSRRPQRPAVPRLVGLRDPVIATAASARSPSASSASTRMWMWKLLFGASRPRSRCWARSGFVRRYVSKFGIWAVARVDRLPRAVDPRPRPRPAPVAAARNGRRRSGSRVDLVIALSVSWVPLVADYTRFSRTRRAAFWGAGVGYLLPTLFQFGFGAILVLSHPSIGGDATNVLTTVAAGGVGEPPRPARAHGGRDGRGVREHLLDRGLAAELASRARRSALLILGVAMLATAGALAVNLTKYPQFLSCSALLRPALRRPARRLAPPRAPLHARGHLRGPAFRPGMIAAWLVGFLVYEWIAQTAGLGFWTDFWHRHQPPDWLPFGASIPSFVVTFVLAFAVSVATRARVAAPAEAG